MRGYLLFVAKRFVQLLAVVIAGISITFVITHLSPVNPVESVLNRMTARSQSSPEGIAAMRAALTEMYGVDRPIIEQFISFWQRLLVGDFGPSLLAWPTPAMELIARALPWTLGLLITATLITWLVGNILGGLAGYYQDRLSLKAFGVVAMGIQPIPYYIVAFILLIIFGFFWPILPISGGFAMNVRPGWTTQFAGSILLHAILPAASLVIVGIGTWFLGMRALVSNIVTEDYVVYAELAGVDRRRVVGSYVIRNALVPQLTALAMALGGVFSGTVITENVFNYPGLGSLLVDAVNAGDYTLVLAVGSVSIAAVAGAIFIIDLVHPFVDPRVRVV
jgi:peptide/nickel transport system permease protein